MEGLIGMSSVGLKYGPESVLLAQAVIAGFGTKQLSKSFGKIYCRSKLGDSTINGQTELDNFLAAEKARKEKEDRVRQDLIEAVIRTLQSMGKIIK